MKRILFLLVTYAFTACNHAQVTTSSLDSLVGAYARNNAFNGSVLVAQKEKFF